MIDMICFPLYSSSYYRYFLNNICFEMQIKEFVRKFREYTVLTSLLEVVECLHDVIPSARRIEM